VEPLNWEMSGKSYLAALLRSDSAHQMLCVIGSGFQFWATRSSGFDDLLLGYSNGLTAFGRPTIGARSSVPAAAKTLS